MTKTLQTSDEIGKFALATRGSHDAAVEFLQKDIARWEAVDKDKPSRTNQKNIDSLKQAIWWVQNDKKFRGVQ